MVRQVGEPDANRQDLHEGWGCMSRGVAFRAVISLSDPGQRPFSFTDGHISTVLHTNTASVVLMEATACGFAEGSTIDHTREQQKGRGVSLVMDFTTPNPEGGLPGTLEGHVKALKGEALLCDQYFRYRFLLYVHTGGCLITLSSCHSGTHGPQQGRCAWVSSCSESAKMSPGLKRCGAEASKHAWTGAFDALGCRSLGPSLPGQQSNMPCTHMHCAKQLIDFALAVDI